jgi:hypothetical protein
MNSTDIIMRKISLIILSCLFAMTSMAQEEMSIQAAIDACVAMRDAVAADDKDGIKQHDCGRETCAYQKEYDGSRERGRAQDSP